MSSQIRAVGEYVRQELHKIPHIKVNELECGSTSLRRTDRVLAWCDVYFEDTEGIAVAEVNFYTDRLVLELTCPYPQVAQFTGYYADPNFFNESLRAVNRAANTLSKPWNWAEP